jgi:hypothetical protein
VRPPPPPKAPTPPPKPPSPPDEKKVLSRPELASYQFPVDEEEEEDHVMRHQPNLSKQPPASALKKTCMDGHIKSRKKTPAFRERVEIINVDDEGQGSGSENVADVVHPSNMEFSDEVLQGRRVAFHTIPKEAPLKIAIRGGTDTPLGGQILISRILEGGAAEKYGKVNVGDQLLVCDGVSLLDVTHDEAAQALKRAMDMESNSIDLVVAVNPDFDTGEEDTQSPHTMWPPQREDTVLEEPAPGTRHDYAHSSHRSHSGFTLRGKGDLVTTKAHAFLPTTTGEEQ